MEDIFQKNRKKIVLTADDFGVSPRANRNILHLTSLGKIDRVAVMTYGNFTDKEIEQLQRSGVKIDIHLDILHEFHDERKGRQSAIWRVVEFIGKLFSGKISPKKVERDWRNQIKKFQEIFGNNPDGINSHEHVHLFPPFFKIALKLTGEYSIPYIRLGDSVFTKHPTNVARILHWLRKMDMNAYKKASCVSSGSLVSLDWISNIEAFWSNLPEGTIEVACHPELAEDFVKIKKYF